tara:strand:+ start:1098 stop:2444 length:1347 start_codon:yes stop_codon:yes gene_type:complete
MKGRLEMIGDRSFMTSLQNTRSFLKAQQAGLTKALQIYNRMEELTIRATDPTLRHGNRRDYDAEFSVLREELEEIMQSEFNGRRLFNDTVICGGAKDIPLGELDLAGGKPPGVSHAVRAQTVDVNSPAGTISFRINSGGVGDTYRVWMGNICVFSAGNPFTGPDHTRNYDDPGGFGYPGNGWETSGSAMNGDDDLFEISFAPGQPTTYKVTPGASNDDGSGNSAHNTYDPATGLYANIFTNDLPQLFTNTDLTLQIETSSIGIIYATGNSANGDADNSGTGGITFVPTNFELEVPIDIHGNTMGLDPKGFGTLGGESPVTGSIHGLDTIAKAADTLDHLRGNKYANDATISYYGEEKCIVSERLASVGAEVLRIDSEIRELQDQIVQGERAFGRITDADMAREATRLARNSLKMDLAEQIMSKSAHLKDVLIPLTTQHYRGGVLNSTI